MEKHVNLVDLVKIFFPTNILIIFLQNLASIQKRTSPIKFAHLAEKSENGSISNLSTKARRAARLRGPAGEARGIPVGLESARWHGSYKVSHLIIVPDLQYCDRLFFSASILR